MIGMVVVTHGRLAEEFVSAMEHVVGPQEAVRAICIGPDDDMELRRQDIMNAVKDADQGSGVILLTDMFGGTPSNLSMRACSADDRVILYGANLPMLIKLAKSRPLSVHDAVENALAAGRKYVDIFDVKAE